MSTSEPGRGAEEQGREQRRGKQKDSRGHTEPCDAGGIAPQAKHRLRGKIDFSKRYHPGRGKPQRVLRGTLGAGCLQDRHIDPAGPSRRPAANPPRRVTVRDSHGRYRRFLNGFAFSKYLGVARHRSRWCAERSRHEHDRGSPQNGSKIRQAATAVDRRQAVRRRWC